MRYSFYTLGEVLPSIFFSTDVLQSDIKSSLNLNVVLQKAIVCDFLFIFMLLIFSLSWYHVADTQTALKVSLFLQLFIKQPEMKHIKYT